MWYQKKENKTRKTHTYSQDHKQSFWGLFFHERKGKTSSGSFSAGSIPWLVHPVLSAAQTLAAVQKSKQQASRKKAKPTPPRGVVTLKSNLLRLQSNTGGALGLSLPSTQNRHHEKTTSLSTAQRHRPVKWIYKLRWQNTIENQP